MVNGSGIRVDPGKVSAIQEIPLPNSKTEIRSFLSLTGYYRTFIRGIVEMTAYLHEATSVKRQFVRTRAMDDTFHVLKRAITTAPVLAFPDFTSPFVVETDASGVALEAVLSQKNNNGHLHPIYFSSWTLNASEKSYTA